MDGSRQYGPIMIAFVVGLAVGVVATLLVGRLGDFLNIEANPMASVSQVSTKEPALLRPEVVMGRLDSTTGAKWDMNVFTLRSAHLGGKPLVASAERIRTKMDMPPVQGKDVLGVFTNVFDQGSVDRNGSLSMIWFGRPDLARDYLNSEPVAFTDPKVQKRTDKYWVGGVAVFYAPGKDDRTDKLRTLFKQMVLCSNRAGACRIPSDVAAFDDWAPRAK